jgi:PAS domain S-box-containing protein
VGREPPVIAAELADVLVGSLRVESTFVRLCDPKGGSAIEVMRGYAWAAFPEWLQTHPGVVGQFSAEEIVADLGSAEPWRGVVIPVGVNAEAGLIAAASTRPDFPSEIDRLLLSVAANHAAVAFQNARLRHELDAKVAELRQARNELETKVSERTADLQRSEAYLAEAQGLTHTGSWACNIATGEMRHSSEEHSRLYGFDPGRGIPSFGECVQRIHPEDRPRVVEIAERANRAGKDFEAHFRVVPPGGPTRYVHAVGHPVFNASGDVVEYLGILIDVTERRRADEERERLLASERAAVAEAVAAQQRFRDLVNSVEGIVWESDPNCQYLFISKQAERVLGYPVEQWLSEPTFWKDHVHPEDRDWALQFCRHAAAEKRNHEVEYRMIAADGSVVWLRDLVTVVVEGDRVTRERGVMVDLTKRKQAEEALRQAQADLAHVSRVTTMGELTASMAHEVNQPIAAAVTDADTCLRFLTLDPPDMEEARAAAARMVNDGARAAEIISRIRLLFKKGTPQHELVDVNEVIEGMIILLRGETTRYSISVRTELAADLPRVIGDRVQLQQVLMNLMINGIEAMKDVDGTRGLAIKSQRAEHAQVLISVSDTGVGLPPQHTDQIFNAFFTTKPHGTGLGLRISRSIIESHGGRLWAADHSPRGASFCFTLLSSPESQAAR